MTIICAKVDEENNLCEFSSDVMELYMGKKSYCRKIYTSEKGDKHLVYASSGVFVGEYIQNKIEDLYFEKGFCLDMVVAYNEYVKEKLTIDNDEIAYSFLVYDGVSLWFFTSENFIEKVKHYTCIGSGSDFAISSNNVMVGAKKAIDHCQSCGGGIHYVRSKDSVLSEEFLPVSPPVVSMEDFK